MVLKYIQLGSKLNNRNEGTKHNLNGETQRLALESDDPSQITSLNGLRLVVLTVNGLYVAK